MKPQNVFLSHALFGSASALSLPNSAHAILSRDVSNSSTPTNKSLSWAECNLDFGAANNAIVDALPEKPECAKLEVPLDYTSLSSGETIELQLIRFKANKEPYKGSIIYNPGGPGGSGVERTIVSPAGGLQMRDIVGGQYDIVSFDPRGVGRTIPFACNITATETAPTLARREFNTLPQANIWAYFNEFVLGAAEAIADACFRDQAKYGRFIGTAFGARDLISIADALDQGPKVNYWGTSYGTVLGQVFTSMFPERVGRVLLDANLLAEDYASTTWITAQRDVERALHKLFDGCVEAGPGTCVLANHTGTNTTGDSLMSALDEAIQEKLDDDTEGEDFGLLYVLPFKVAIVGELYGPATYFDAIERVNHVLTGNWTAAVTPTPNMLASEWNQGEHAMLGISCADSSFRAENRDDFYSVYQARLAQGSFADSVPDRLYCGRWRFSSAEQIDLNALRNVKTSYPVLVVNGHYDPGTSESSAWEVSARLRNSRMVVHMGVGHGFRNHPSKCTNDVVRDYFADGKLPEVGTVCEPDKSAFEVAIELKEK
ncbi:hypothetical protein CkaCkLH20_07142 [Colletotrichum karsti]|uniref:Tripeptidyl aminopeptidase n=1 Tax=Colletotrichum karsti TaxID=1095194 RepID=A0A9P6I1N0_9PEZI|nr:uncharacterized protein CkaCkLH20_07142 [Colletotrichum karsti]KAF9875322.1 hypothetical protein CkaCkLH20_07142 [Colletotrichum karsti]